MKKIKLLFGYVVLLFLFISCSNEPDSDPLLVSIKQQPGCKSNSLGKKTQQTVDSCFSYTFNSKLMINFCVSGNCCPGENRFKYSTSIIYDTINITVTDTAKNLCKCICNYLIDAEFEQLAKKSYFIHVYRLDSEKKTIIYDQLVSSSQ